MESRETFLSVPRLSAIPFHDRAAFPHVHLLENAIAAIVDEIPEFQSFEVLEAHRVLVGNGMWSRFPFYNYGHRYDDNCRACPQTAAIIEAIPGATAAGLAYFSALQPHTDIVPHVGPTNTRIRTHLPLVVPAGCTLTVGGETRAWTEGECVVFDDSFEHSATNPTAEPRIVLVVDIWHPELSSAETAELRRTFEGEGGLRPRPVEAPFRIAGALCGFTDPNFSSG